VSNSLVAANDELPTPSQEPLRCENGHHFEHHEVTPLGDPLVQGRPINGVHDSEARRTRLVQPTDFVADAFWQHPASLSEPLTDL
jgi:hypothetical protein